MLHDAEDSSWPPGITPPPSVDELLTDDGEPLESNRHRLQMTLLIETLDLAWSGRNDYFAGGNMFLYYSALQAKKHDFRGPDFFVALGTERRDRKAWVIWEEDGKRPDVIVELTSETTAAIDRGIKKRVYGHVVGVPEYFIYDPFTHELEGYRLDAGASGYVPIAPTPTGRLPSQRLGLELGTWSGPYLDYEGPWLRWFTREGELLATPREAEQQARKAEQQAREAEQQAREAEQQARGAEQQARGAEQQAHAELERMRAELRRIEADRQRDEARLLAYEQQFGKLNV